MYVDILESFLDNIKGWEYVLNSLPDLITILNTQFKVVWVNNAMAETLGADPESCKGLLCYEVVHGTESPISNCPHEKMMQDGIEHTEEVYEANLGGYFLVTASPIKDDSGKLLGSVHIARNITERKMMEDKIKKSLEEREMLIKETHHRVKNNLMVISSLLNLQARYIKDKKTKDIFKESQTRARSMALIHEKLYQTADLEEIDFGDYVKKLSSELFRTYSEKSENISLEFDVEDHNLNIKIAIPLGLILNELISNSLKYAFPVNFIHRFEDKNREKRGFSGPKTKGFEGSSIQVTESHRSANSKFASHDNKKGLVKVKFVKKDEKYIFEVSDNGIGLSDDFDIENIDSLGLRIITNLVNQINGHLDFDGHDGATFTITFEKEKLKT